MWRRWFSVSAAVAHAIGGLPLALGGEIPRIGLGTYLMKTGEAKAAVEHAIRAGYRHIDAASIYQNHQEVGSGIAAAINGGVVAREVLFVTSKLWMNSFHPSRVEEACRRALNELGLEYLDLYLLHWPVAWEHTTDPQHGDLVSPYGDILRPRGADGHYLVDTSITLSDTWAAMEGLVHKGLVKAIGVSNFEVEEIQGLLKTATIFPTVNQVESHVYWSQTRLRDWCHSNNIVFEAYAPLGSPDRNSGEASPIDDHAVQTVAKAHKKTPAQVLLRWGLQRDHVVIPKSKTPSRIEENFRIFDFALTDEEMILLDSLSLGPQQKRYFNPDFREGGRKVFNDEGREEL